MSDSTLKRRSFVKKLAAAGGAGLASTSILAGCASGEESGGAANVVTSPRVTWRLVSSFSRSLDTIFGAAEVLSERVSSLTDGKFSIRVFPAGEFVPALEVLGAVQNQTAQMGHSASYYFTGKAWANGLSTKILKKNQT